MSMPRTHSWNASVAGPMTETAIRAQHEPAWHYRISPNRYDPGVAFRGTARAGKIYVLTGSCRYEWATGHAELRPATFVDAPDGEYSFEVLSAVPCEIVHVWLLPPEFRQRPSTGAAKEPG